MLVAFLEAPSSPHFLLALKRTKVTRSSSLPGPVLRAGHVLGIRHLGSETEYDTAPKELMVDFYYSHY